MTKRLGLVDLSGCWWRAWHAGADRELGFAFTATLEQVQRFADGYDHVAICCDAPPYWRKQILESYKAQRDRPEPQAIEQLRRVEERLAADGYCIWKCDGYEADDVIATAVRYATDPDADELFEVVIGSSDKDMLQLVSDARGVSAFSMAMGIRYDDAAVAAKFGVRPGLMRDFLALCGDSSDNVPGVPGVGPKKAAALLAEFGSAQGVLAGCDKIKTPAMRTAVFESGDAVRLAYKLVGLKDDCPINFSDALKTRVASPLVETEDDDVSNDDMTERETEPPSAPEVDAEPVPPVGEQQPAAPAVQHQPKSQAIEKTNGNGSMMTAPAATFDEGLQPGTLDAAWKLAGHLFNSRLYPKLPNRDAIFAVMIRGREIGLNALTALDTIHYLEREGRTAFGAHLLIARAMAHPDCEYFEFLGGDGTYAEYETKHRRNKNPTRLKYTIEDAKTAGLVVPGQPGKRPPAWIARPAEMLRKTSGVMLARLVYPSALLGAYAHEEFSE